MPTDPAVDDTLGWVYVRKGQPKVAVRHLADAVRAQPGSALFRYHLGIAYARTGEFLKARDELTRALELDPNFPGALDARTALKALPR